MDFSNNIAFERVHYDSETKSLFIIFRNGHGTKYLHKNVPKDVFSEFKQSNFSNRYYYDNIKDKYKKEISFLNSEEIDYLNFLKY